MTTDVPTKKKLTPEQKAAMKLFRERRGGLNKAQQEANRQNDKRAAALLEQLASGPATVPELAQRTGLPPARVLWHLAGLRKYGQAQEVDTAGDYVRYGRVEKDDP